MFSFHSQSLLLASVAIHAVFSLVFLRLWRQGGRRLDFLLWALAAMSGAFGAILASTGTALSIPFGQGLLLMSLALAWQGLRSFDHRAVHLQFATMGPVLWAAFTASFAVFNEDSGLRFVFFGLISALYCGLILREHWISARSERLPSRGLIAAWFAVHGITGLVLAGNGMAELVTGQSDAIVTTPSLWSDLLEVEFLLSAFLGNFSAYVMVKERLQLENQWVAATDTLTGLVNRRTFLDMMQTLSFKIRGEGAFLYVDVDHVKRINDRFGHSSGDEVLRSCSQLMARELPSNALIGRLAGAEFAAYVPDCDVDRAAMLGSLIHDTVAEQMFFFGAEMVTVTVSVGIAHGAMQVTPDELLKRADAALHTAKVRGRNAVVVWDEGQAPAFG
ncbi:diguanylate cyclase [Rhizobium sp. AAP43]|uniref:GGDEF domain-containing protein n=1 Tax=Rhizobium sp. AAP43 TaxID=1523420 RepID=UPI0006B8E8B5|nr:GGDEF domain-containing protein [Rhizobium sp. AAP43]KPF44130.1 hypothetical protein IP76_12080 [Rhizobium sp. AAP43]